MLDYIAIAISIFSLGVSGYVLWNDYLKRFALEINTAGRIIILNDPASRNVTKKFMFALPILIANTGAMSGTVKDLAIKISDEGGNSILFRSWVEFTDEELNFSAELKGLPSKAFHGFQLGKKESVNLTPVFRQFDLEDPFDLKKGKYRLTLLFRTSRSQDWEELAVGESLTFTIVEDDINELNKGGFLNDPSNPKFNFKMIAHNKPLDDIESALQSLRSEDHLQ